MFMPKAISTKQMTAQELQKYEEIVRIYKSLYKELENLDVEGKNIKKEIKTIIDKAKMRNILQDILKQPD
jgi:hypothetical protein